MTPFFLLLIENESDRNFMINIYNTYYPLMKKYSIYITKSEIDTEDLINNTCVKLIEHIDTIREFNQYQLASYIKTTIVRMSYSHVNSKYKKRRVDVSGYPYDFFDRVEDITENTEKTALLNISVETLARTLLNLPQKYQDILKYKYFLEMSDAEIGKTLGISKENVRVYIKRARDKAYSLAERGSYE